MVGESERDANRQLRVDEAPTGCDATSRFASSAGRLRPRRVLSRANFRGDDALRAHPEEALEAAIIP